MTFTFNLCDVTVKLRVIQMRVVRLPNITAERCLFNYFALSFTHTFNTKPYLCDVL
jgi:hypothetical protein